MRSNRWAPEILIHHTADTPAQGRFCVEYSLAVALADGEAGIAQYTDERIADPALRKLAERVEVVVDEALAVGRTAFSATVAVETTDGRRLNATVDQARGTPELPLGTDELVAKFRSCSDGTLPADRLDRALELLLALDELPRRERTRQTLVPA